MTQDGQPAVTTNDVAEAVPRDPDVIALEIEQTRAELADTVDRIADRVSPRRVASRKAASAKAQVDAVKAGELPLVTVAAVTTAVAAIAVAVIVLLRRRSR